ncbi:MAG: hypothetical protein K0S74_1810 [Chlamydiales bacterium]|nr:hypothetical protein [Chlamydiales bacterium]
MISLIQSNADSKKYYLNPLEPTPKQAEEEIQEKIDSPENIFFSKIQLFDSSKEKEAVKLPLLPISIIAKIAFDAMDTRTVISVSQLNKDIYETIKAHPSNTLRKIYNIIPSADFIKIVNSIDDYALDTSRKIAEIESAINAGNCDSYKQSSLPELIEKEKEANIILKELRNFNFKDLKKVFALAIKILQEYVDYLDWKHEWDVTNCEISAFDAARIGSKVALEKVQKDASSILIQLLKDDRDRQEKKVIIAQYKEWQQQIDALNL